MGTPKEASGKGQSFLLLAGGPVGGQPAQPGGSRAPRSRSRELSPAERGPGEGALCAALPGEHLTRGGRAAPICVREPPWPLPKRPASLLRSSSPAPTPSPPPPFPSSFTGSPRLPSSSDRLAAARLLVYPPLAAHSLQHREPGPAPGEGAAGKLQPGPNPLLLDLREPGKRAEAPRAARCGTAQKKSLTRTVRVSPPGVCSAGRSHCARTGPLVGSAHSDCAWLAGSTVATSVPTSGRIQQAPYSPGLKWKVVYK